MAKKKKKKNPIRIFHEKWKWYFVNTYIIIIIAIIVHLHFVCFDSCDTDAKQIDEPKNEGVAEEVIVEKPAEETVALEADEDDVLVEEAVEQVADDPIPDAIPKAIVLINTNSKTDRVASAILAGIKDAEVIEVEKEFDNTLIEDIVKRGENENQDVYIIGGPYVVSLDSETKITDLSNITINRLSGSSMESTGVAIIDHISDSLDFSKVYITNAAISENCVNAAGISKDTRIPVFLVDYSGLSSVVESALIKYNVQKVELIGKGISSKTISQLEAIVGAENLIK